MKTIARFILAAAVLAAVGLHSGCATPNRGRIARVTPLTFEIRVVDSSSTRPVSPEELNILRANLVGYLADQGELVGGKKYYLRVDFTPEKAGEPGEWLVVELFSPLGETYSVATAYRNSPPAYYPDYTRPGYSTYYSYYQEPYDYSTGGSYSRPVPLTPRRGDRPHDRDKGDKPRDRTREDRPPGTDPRGGGHDGDRDRDHRPRTGDSTPRSDDSGRGRGRDSDHSAPTTANVSSGGGSSGNSGSGSGGGSSSSPPPPAPSYNPPPEPVRSESSNTGIQKDSALKEEN